MKKIILFTFLVVGSIIYATNLSNSMEIVNAESALMHGPRNPNRYPVCSNCLLISCDGSNGNCSGHCRRNGKLRNCFSSNDRQAR